LETIAAMLRIRLVCKIRGVERAVKPIAAAVACKYPAGSIPAMRGRRQTDD
jgi:hypothetical protein